MALSVRLETKHTPIVIVSSGMDLVSIGLAASLARPGSNVTGSQDLQSETFGKRLQLLKECVPTLSRVASLIERATTTGVFTSEELALSEHRRAATARSLGLELHSFIAFRPEDFPTLFRDMVKNGDRGLIVTASPFTFVHRKQIVDLAANHRIATISAVRWYVDAGGLMSYGAKSLAVWRRTAAFVDKILKGANPGDLPVEQSTEFELVINLKTAKALGLTVPPSLLQRADEVIE